MSDRGDARPGRGVEQDIHCDECGSRLATDAEHGWVCLTCDEPRVGPTGLEGDLEAAYRSVTKARQWAMGLAEHQIPRVEDTEEWEPEHIEALGSAIEQIRNSTREIGDELLSAQVSLEEAREGQEGDDAE